VTNCQKASPQRFISGLLVIVVILIGIGGRRSSEACDKSSPALKFYFSSLHTIDPFNPGAPLLVDEDTVSLSFLSEVAVYSGTYDSGRPIVSYCKSTTCLCLAYLCYDSAPSGASLLPDKRQRATRPENPMNSTLSGQKG
jgi:hypothetical protein